MCRSQAEGARRCPGDGGEAHRTRQAEQARHKHDQPQLDFAAEQAGWDAIGVISSGIADAWIRHGFPTPADAKVYRDLGIEEPAEAAAWRDASSTLPRILAWIESGYTPADAAAYRARGILTAGAAQTEGRNAIAVALRDAVGD